MKLKTGLIKNIIDKIIVGACTVIEGEWYTYIIS